MGLSVAGGVSVAYVFVHLLPELAEGQRHVHEALKAAQQLGGVGLSPSAYGFAQRHVYLIALAGLAVFYGLEKLAMRSRRPSLGEDDETTNTVFWIHIASFAAYNMLIGYLLIHRERVEAGSTLFFAVAMALHFVVTDSALHDHHQQRYRRFGRWLLVLALGAGILLGAATGISRAATAAMTAFLAGGIILNVLKEEVPNERQGRFWAFAAGMTGYAILLLIA